MQFGPPTADEFALVFDAWARSFKKSPWAGCVPNQLWDQVSRACASELVDRSRVIVAHVPIEGGRRVMGYSVSEPGILHWLFVKRDYRGMGVGRALLDETVRGWPPAPWKYTHRTRASSSFLRSRFAWDPVPARVK